MTSLVRAAGAPARAAASKLKARLTERRTAAVFVFSVGAVNVASLFGNALAFRWVEPASMGVWHTLLLAGTYLNIVRLGLISGMGRELPYALGSGDRARAERIAATSLGYTLFCCTLAAALFGVVGPSWTSPHPAWSWALPSMAVVTAANLYLSYLMATFRSDSEFALLSRLHWIHAGTALLMPLMVLALGFPGLCLHAAIQAVVLAAYAHSVRPLPVPVRFDPRLAGRLIATGLPIFIAGYLQTAAAGFDRIILLKRGTVETVGYYAPALAVISAMAIVPGAVATYVYPRMSYALGQGQQRGVLRHMALTAGAVSFLVGVPVALVGWIVAPAAILALFPQYEASIPAVRWSLLSGLLWSVSPAVQALGSLKAWRSLFAYVAVLLAARWSFPWFLSAGRDPLEGVALGNVCAAACAGLVALVLVRRTTATAPVEEAA